MSDALVRHDDRAGVPMITDPGLHQILGGYAEQTWQSYIIRARVWISRLHINPIGLAPEGAVQSTWVVLCKQIAAGTLEPPSSRTEFDGVFGLLLLHVLFDERKRQRARKRGLGMVVPLDEAAHDVADPHGGEPGEEIAAGEWADWILAQLACHNGSLRDVVIGRMNGDTSSALAVELGVSVTTIERMFREIRSILEPYLARGGMTAPHRSPADPGHGPASQVRSDQDVHHFDRTGRRDSDQRCEGTERDSS